LAGAESGSQRRFRFDPADAGNQKHWAGLWFGDEAEAVERRGGASGARPKHEPRRASSWLLL
jgi:hypothetical protein